MMKLTYSDIIQAETFEKRFQMLKLNSLVGNITFGGHRYLNQQLYMSRDWRRLRRQIVLRDNGCDLAVPGMEIAGFDKNGKKQKIILHHINPISIDDILSRSFSVMDPENLICVSEKTHNMIHFGIDDPATFTTAERFPNDTCPWKR